MSRSLLVRMAALVAVLLASFAYIAFDVAGWRLGAQDYRVTVQMPRGGGIYTEAYVTYRGVTVGRVVKLAVRPGGVDVVAAIRPGVRIPADSTVAVRSLTAAGEQYLDFTPRAPGGPYLHRGSVVAAARTSQPVPISQVLSDTSRLLNSINANQLNTVTSTLGTGLGGTDNELRAIVVDGQTLFAALQQVSGPTVQLITSGNTVLHALDNTDAAFGQFASGIDQVSAQLKASNGDITALLGNGLLASQQTSLLLDRYSGSFVSLLDHAGTVAGVSLAEQPELQALFQVLPVFAGRIGSIVHNGSLNVSLDFNTDDPVCTYVSGAQAPLPTQKVDSVPLNRNCSTPGLIPRGAG